MLLGKPDAFVDWADWLSGKNNFNPEKGAECRLDDAAGLIILADKASEASAIDSAQSPILSRLGLSNEQWITLTTEFEQQFC